MTLALAGDIDAIAERRPDRRRLAARAAATTPAPYTSTIVFLVRKGNPKGIKDWGDLVKRRRRGDHAEPEDLGRRALELPRRLGLGRTQQAAATRPRRSEFVDRSSISNVPVLDTGARGSTTTFVAARHRRRAARLGERGLPRCSRSSAPDKFEIVVSAARRSWPSRRSPWSTRTSTSTARARSREAYLEYPLHADEAQTIAAKQLLPAVDPEARRPGRPRALPEASSWSPSTIRSSAAGAKAQPEHFGDGGIFDQIYAARRK